MYNQEIIGCPRKKYLVLLRKDQKEMDHGQEKVQVLFLFEFGDKEYVSRSLGRVSDWKC